MAVSKQFTVYLEQELSRAISQEIRLKHVTSVSGGSINAAYCLHTSHGDFMMKRNSKSAYPGMFACERAGLVAISNTQTIATPQVIIQADFEDNSFLILEWIEAIPVTPSASRILGRQLAAMHRHTFTRFGFDHDNYMGSIAQRNTWHDTWAGFFVSERLMPMVNIATNKGLLHSNDVRNFETLYQSISSLFSEEVPALLHGDLWSGNYLIGNTQKPYLIDPAVSYGHREFDLAMTTLFGGFDNEFYDAYQESFPLTKGWRQRSNLWNLYPLLLHLNLFGTGYLSRIRSCLQQFS